MNKVKNQMMRVARSKVKIKKQYLKLVKQEQISKKSIKPVSWAKS